MFTPNRQKERKSLPRVGEELPEQELEAIAGGSRPKIMAPVDGILGVSFPRLEVPATGEEILRRLAESEPPST
jgi:hypothetical protein